MDSISIQGKEESSDLRHVSHFQRRNGLHLPSVLLAIVFDSFSIAFIAVVLSLALLTFNYVSIAFALSPFTKNIHTRLLTTIGLQVCLASIYYLCYQAITYTRFMCYGCTKKCIAIWVLMRSTHCNMQVAGRCISAIRHSPFPSQHDTSHIRVLFPSSLWRHRTPQRTRSIVRSYSHYYAVQVLSTRRRYTLQ